jgi:hypothetical protein
LKLVNDERNIKCKITNTIKMDEYIAVVGPNRVGGISSTESSWWMAFTIEAHIKNNDELLRKQISVSKDVSHLELKDLQNKINPYSIIKFQGKIVKEADREYIRLITLIEVDLVDDRLQYIVQDLQKPVVYESEILGDLTLEKRFDWFEGTINWGAITVGITLSVVNNEPIEHQEELAINLMRSQDQWNKQIQAFVLQKLLPLKNSNWRNDDGSLETDDSFMKKMTLQTISINSGNTFTFWYDDGDLFFGHSIVVVGDINNGITSATIAG